LDQWIRDLVTRVGSINFKAIGIIGGLALIYAAISMLVEVERAFNQIYRVPLGRSWARRIVNYWTLLTLGAVGLGLSFYLTNTAGAELSHFVQTDRLSKGGGQVLGVALQFLSTVTISTLMFLLIYSVIPNTRVQFTAALTGAVVAAIVWEASKWGFTQYLRFSHGYAKLYGSIALIPLFLLWVYVTWCIVLFGLNVAYYLQHGRHHTAAEPVDVAEPLVIDPGAILAVLAALARRFQTGKPADACEISDEIKIPAGIAREMLASLTAAGYAHRVQRPNTEGDDEPLYALSRPPDQISAEEIVRLGDDLTGAAGRGPVGEAMRTARLAAVRGRTLATFLDAAAPPATAAPATPRPLPT
jgi:membrane protein